MLTYIKHMSNIIWHCFDILNLCQNAIWHTFDTPLIHLWHKFDTEISARVPIATVQHASVARRMLWVRQWGMQPPVGSRIVQSWKHGFYLHLHHFPVYILHLVLFGTVTVLLSLAVGQRRHHTNHPSLASLYKLLQGLPLQVSSIK